MIELVCLRGGDKVHRVWWIDAFASEREGGRWVLLTSHDCERPTRMDGPWNWYAPPAPSPLSHIHTHTPQKQVREKHPDVSVWSLISEDHLQTKGEEPGAGEGEETPAACCGRDGRC